MRSTYLGPPCPHSSTEQMKGKVPAEAVGQLRQLLHEVRGMTPEQLLELLKPQH
jgi:hypothetical protein